MVFQGFPTSVGPPIQSQGADFAANNKPTPGFLTQGTEQGALWGGWREVAGSFWTLQNADYIGGQWQQLNQTVPSWSFALIAGGGFAMYFAPATGSASTVIDWQTAFAVSASGAITTGGAAVITAETDLSPLNIFNALFYGVSTTAAGTANVAALNAAGAAAQVKGGGEIWIPNIAGGQVPMAGTVVLPNTVNNSVNVHGTSNAQILQQSLGVDTFFSNNAGNPGNRCGVTFSTIHVFYNNPLTTGAAFNIQDRNGYLDNIVVEDAPIGVWFQNCLSAVLSNSDILYHNNLGSTGIIIGGAAGRAHQTRVSRTQVEFNNSGTIGSIGLQILGVDHFTADDCYFFGCVTGIAIQPVSGLGGCNQISIVNTQIGAQETGIFIQPQSPTIGQAQDVRVFGGQIQGGGSAGPSSTGLYIDTRGGANTQVDGLEFIGVLVESWGLAGYTITSGQNIQIIGGRCSSNGTSGILLATNLTYGPENVECIGLDLSATYQNNPAQTYAIVVDMPSAATGSATFTNCPMLGYTGSPLSVEAIASGFILKIFNCPGYNDQRTPIVPDGTNMPTSVTSASLKGYYGPSIFTPGTSATSYTKNGINYPITSTGIPVPLDPYDTIFQTGSTNGNWIGV